MKKISRAAQMAKDLLNYKAMDIMTMASAFRDTLKLGKDRYMASGVLIQVTDLSGKVLIGPVMITDGLSQGTIDALRADIKASYDYRLQMNKIADPVDDK